MAPATVWAYVAVCFVPYVVVAVSEEYTMARGFLWTVLGLLLLYWLLRGSRLAWGILLAFDVFTIVILFLSLLVPYSLATNVILASYVARILLLVAPPTRRFVSVQIER